jgi:hypothetical protein
MGFFSREIWTALNGRRARKGTFAFRISQRRPPIFCMSYSDKLRDPRWQKKRLEIFQRDNFTCLACRSKDDTLCVHHLKYVNEPWDCPNEFLETLCESCHACRTNFDDFFGRRTDVPSRAIWWLLRLVALNPPSLSDPKSQLRRIIFRDVSVKEAAVLKFELPEKFLKLFPEVNPTTFTISLSADSTCESRSGNHSEGRDSQTPGAKTHIAAAKPGVATGAGLA